jgi:hypothetical protein
LADGDPLYPPQIWGTSGHLLLKTGWRSAQPQPVDLLPALQHHLFVGYHSTPSSYYQQSHGMRWAYPAGQQRRLRLQS